MTYAFEPHHMDEQKQDDKLETTYIQFCADTGSSLEDLLKAMDDREVWREKVRDIRADAAT